MSTAMVSWARSAGDAGRRVSTRLSTGRTLWSTAVATAVIHMALVLYRDRNGVSVPNDGLLYLSRARALAMGNLALDPAGSVPPEGLLLRLHQPPGYPALLAALHRVLPVSLTQAALIVNLVAALALALGIACLAREVLGRLGTAGPWPAMLTVATVLSAPTLMVTSGVLSDTSFFACWVWMTVWLVRWVLDRRTGSLVVAGALGTLLLSLRWVGIFLLIATVLVMAADGLRRRRWPLAAGLFAALSMLPMALWWRWSATYEGPPEPGVADGVLSPVVSFIESVVGLGSDSLGALQGRTGGVMGRGSFPLPAGLAGMAAAVSFAVGAILLVALAWVLIEALVTYLRRPDVPPITQVVLAVGLPIAAYAALFYVARASTGYFVLPRYWGIFPFFAWLLFVVWQQERRAAWAVAAEYVYLVVVAANLFGLAYLTL